MHCSHIMLARQEEFVVTEGEKTTLQKTAEKMLLRLRGRELLPVKIEKKEGEADIWWYFKKRSEGFWRGPVESVSRNSDFMAHIHSHPVVWMEGKTTKKSNSKAGADALVKQMGIAVTEELCPVNHEEALTSRIGASARSPCCAL